METLNIILMNLNERAMFLLDAPINQIIPLEEQKFVLLLLGVATTFMILKTFKKDHRFKES